MDRSSGFDRAGPYAGGRKKNEPTAPSSAIDLGTCDDLSLRFTSECMSCYLPQSST